MPRQIRVNGALRTVVKRQVRVNGVLKDVVRRSVRVDGVVYDLYPTVTPPEPPADPIVGVATVSWPLASSSLAVTITVPAGVVPGDRCVLVSSYSNQASTVTGVTGMTLLHNQGSGTMRGQFFQGTGHTAGDTVTITGTNLNPSAHTLVWIRGRTLSGLATRIKTAPATVVHVAPAAIGSVASDVILVLNAEKSGANSDNLPPTVTGVTLKGFAPWFSQATGYPSAYAGTYTGVAEDKTMNYLRATANGVAAQIRLVAA